MRSLMPQDMLRGDLDAHAGVGGHEVLYLVEALAGEVGDGLIAFAAVVVAIVETHQVKRPHRADRARMADRLKGARVRLCRHLRMLLRSSQ